jgi:hypothetical protein
MSRELKHAAEITVEEITLYLETAPSMPGSGTVALSREDYLPGRRTREARQGR